MPRHGFYGYVRSSARIRLVCHPGNNHSVLFLLITAAEFIIRRNYYLDPKSFNQLDPCSEADCRLAAIISVPRLTFRVSPLRLRCALGPGNSRAVIAGEIKITKCARFISLLNLC